METTTDAPETIMVFGLVFDRVSDRIDRSEYARVAGCARIVLRDLAPSNWEASANYVALPRTVIVAYGASPEEAILAIEPEAVEIAKTHMRVAAMLAWLTGEAA